MSTNDVVVLSAARTAIGSFGGSMKSVPVAELATLAVKTAIERAGAPVEEFGHLAMGTVIPTTPKDAYLSRISAMNAGLPKECVAMNVNRLCGSGLQAIVSAAQSLMLGDAELAIGAGAESMSQSAYLLPGQRWGKRMGNGEIQDFMLGALHDPFQDVHMGITAENVAERYDISREDMDGLAAESQRRAARAIEEGRFKSQIVPVEIKSRKGVEVFDTDEHVRGDITKEALAGMRPVFKTDGLITAGNASGLNDGAAAVALATVAAAERLEKKPLARMLGYAHAGVDPAYMGIGPVPSSKKVLEKLGLSVADMDVIESNEAFAAQACAVAKELGFAAEKVNPNGSGISLGHPIGATGAIITTKALYELERIGGRYALVTMCIGGGQGIAVVFERVE